MALPRALREANKRAETLQKELYEQGQDTGNEPTPPQEQPTDPAPQPEPQEPAPQPDPEPTPPDNGHGDQLDEDLGTRLQRLQAAHDTLKGKYKAEVPRLQQELREVKDENAQLSSENQRLKQQLEQSQAREAKSSEELDRALAKLRDEFGDDFTDTLTDVTRSIATEAARGSTPQEPAESQETATQRFMRNVRRNVTDFDTVNTDPAFIQWLNETDDPNTGLPYQETLTQAGRDLDVHSVIRVFDDYRSRNRRPNPADPRSPEAQVEPSTVRREPNPGKPLIDDPLGKYQQLQFELTHTKKWRGREAEARQYEAELIDAINQQNAPA